MPYDYDSLPRPSIFVLNGPSGAGKSTAADLITRRNPSIATVFQKVRTPRTARPEEFRDTIEISNEEFGLRAASRFFTTYSFGAARYGFDIRDLEQATHASRNVFITIRSEQVIQRVMTDLSSASVIPIYIHTDADLIAQRLKSTGASDDVIRERRGRDAAMTYSPFLYMHTIINNGPKEELTDHFRVLLARYGEALAA